jgi:hypothetical protein
MQDDYPYFNESTWECPQYFALTTTYVDWGRYFFYDKTTGDLVSASPWGNGAAFCGQRRLTDPLAGCTMLGDCQSQTDAGAHGN